MKRSSGFAAALMLATALAGAAVGLLGTSMGIRVTVAGLALGACVLGGSVLAGGHRRHFVLLAMVAFVVMGFFSWHLIQIQVSSPFPLRSLHVAALLAYGAVLLAAVLRLLRIADETRALLLAFSIAVPLFIAEALVAPPRTRGQPRWRYAACRFLTSGFATSRAPRAGTTIRTIRGALSSNDSPRDSWALEIREGSAGRLEHSESQAGLMRVTLTTMMSGAEAWHVKLHQAPF